MVCGNSVYGAYTGGYSPRGCKRMAVEPLQVGGLLAATRPHEGEARMGGACTVHPHVGGGAGAAVRGSVHFHWFRPAHRPTSATSITSQFHFHSTSEHLLDGQSASLELHIVTKLVG